jgi:hypothetical protein
MTYRKRAFLNPISTGQPSFIYAVAETSEGGTKEYGTYVLTIGDCKRIIELDFSLTGGPRKRKQSLTKIDLFAEVVNRLKDAIHTEAELIDRRKRK